jgi:all-trans-nonaprenyl-diphosphate synthase
VPEQKVSEQTQQSLERANLFKSIKDDLKKVEQNLLEKLPSESGPLAEIIKFVMSSKGKRLRPALALLCGHLTNSGLPLASEHYTLAELTELIHTASLVHDDVLDEAASRRGEQTCHLKWGTKVSIIVGDFLFAQASVKLGELNNTEVVKIYAKVLSDLCTGEIIQAQQRFELNSINWTTYLNKSISKTASLFAAATKSAAILNKQNTEVIEQMHSYGLNLGIAFQLIDDLIDFTSTAEELGKPAMGDLSQGIFTAPTLYALENSQFKDDLKELIISRFVEPTSIDKARELIEASGAFEKTKELANSYIQKAFVSLNSFPENAYKKDLIDLGKFVLSRIS